MGILKNKFSWSKSRDEQFRECQRQYYYHRYGYWGGWESSADTRTRQLYVLKNLKTRYMWVGEIVHHTIENFLKNFQKTGEAKTEFYLSDLTDRMRREFRASRSRLYRSDPKKNLGLFEHEYEQPISDEKWSSLHDEARRCFTNFANIVFPKMAKPIPLKDWLLIETLQEFFFEETTIYVKVDFAYRDQEGIKIVDWKTGRSEDVDNEIQLDCYGLFSRDYFKVPSTSIKTIVCNINTGKETVREMFEAKMDFAKHYIRNSIAAMKRVLIDPEKNEAREEDFPFTENEQTCRFCNFKKVCPKWAS